MGKEKPHRGTPKSMILEKKKRIFWKTSFFSICYKIFLEMEKNTLKSQLPLG